MCKFIKFLMPIASIASSIWCFMRMAMFVCECVWSKEAKCWIYSFTDLPCTSKNVRCCQNKGDEKKRKMFSAISWNFRYAEFVVYCQLHAMGSVNSFYLLQIGLHPFASASDKKALRKTRHNVTSTLLSVMVYIVSRYNVPEFANQRILYSVNHNEINSLIKFIL